MFKLPSERIWLQSSSWVRRPTQMFLDIIPKYDSQIPCLGLVYLCCDGAQQVWFHMQISLWAPIKIYQAYDTWHGFFDPRIQWLSAVLGSHPHFKTNSKLLVIYPIHINLVTSKRISSYRFRTIDMCFGSHFAKRKHCRTPVFHRAWYMFCLGNLNITFK